VIRFALWLALSAAPQPLTTRDGNIIIEYWPGSERMATALLASARNASAFPGLPPDVLAAGPATRILLAPDEIRFDSITGGRAPDWGAGVALPSEGIIVLPAYNSPRGGTQDLRSVLRHELAHVALQRYLGGAQVPRWFTEGYAVWASGQFDESAGWILRSAFLLKRAPPLDSLTLDWPVNTTDARVAYLLSASAVEYLYANGGERALRIFLERWQQSSAMETALRQTYGLTLGQLERFWSQSVRRRYGWLLFFAQVTVIWTILTVLVLVLFLIRRRRDRRKMNNLRATELPDDPAWWLDSSDEPRRDSEP
jgi:hypothetical protein